MTIDQVLSTKMLLLKHLLQYQLPLPTWISCHLCGWSSSITWISFTPVLLLLQYQLELPNSISSVFCWVFQSQCFGIDVDRFRKVHNYSSSIVVYEDALLQHLLQYWLPPPKWCLAIYAVGTVPLLGSISLQCCYCSSICYKYLLSKPTLRLQIQRIHNSATKRKILLSMQLEYFQFLNLLHSSVATAPVSVTTTSCRHETPGVEKSSIPIDGLEHCYWPSICRKAYCRCQSRSLLSRPPKIVPSSGYLYSSAATAPHLLNSLLSLSTSLFQLSLYQDQSSI